jgi:type I restriction enzyme S subunit
MSELNDLITRLCPDGVPYKKLGDLCTIETGRLNANKAVDDGAYPFFTTAEKTSRINSYRWDTEALLIAGNANVGSVKHYAGKFEAYQRTYVLTNFNQDINVRFLFHFTRAFLKKYLANKSNSAAMTYIVLSTLKNFEIPVPPLPVQEEVVRILDSFTELEAELEAELADRKEQYEYYRDYLLDKNTLEKIDGTAIETKRLDEVFDSFNGMGGVSNKWDDDGNCQFIDYKNVYNNTKVDVSNTPYATVKKISNQRAIKQGDILCTCASEVPNECALSAVVEDNIRDNIFLDDHLFGLRVKEEYADLVNTTYINYYFTTFEHRKNVFKAVHGVTRYYIDTKAFMRIPVPVPSLATQERVVDILDRFDALTTSLTDGIPAEIAMRHEQYEYFRSRLLDFPRLPDDTVSDGE